MTQIQKEDEDILDVEYHPEYQITFDTNTLKQKLLEIGIDQNTQLLSKEQMQTLEEFQNLDLSIDFQKDQSNYFKKLQEYLSIDVDTTKSKLKHKYYSIRGQIIYEEKTIQVNITRRFSEFDFVNKFLIVNFPQKILPFLQKKLFEKIYALKDDSDRIQKLQHYLDVILQDEELKNFQICKIFFLDNKEQNSYLPESTYKNIFQDHKTFLTKIKNPEDSYFNLQSSLQFNKNSSFEQEYAELESLGQEIQKIYNCIQNINDLQNQEFYKNIHKTLQLDQNFEKDKNFQWINEIIDKIQTSLKIKVMLKKLKFVNFRIIDCKKSIERNRQLQNFNNVCKEKINNSSSLNEEQKIKWKMLEIKSQEKIELMKKNFQQNLDTTYNTIKNIINIEFKENFQTMMYDYFYNNQLIKILYSQCDLITNKLYSTNPSINKIQKLKYFKVSTK